MKVSQQNTTSLSRIATQRRTHRILKIYASIACATIMSALASAADKVAEHYDEFTWQNRLLVIKLSAQAEVDVTELERFKAEIDERDILWFKIEGQNLSSNSNRGLSQGFLASLDRLLDEPSTQVVLIGKDGGVKYRSNALQLSVIFDLIDSMPMRQYEIQKLEQ